jgi:hypothetical protein
METFVKTLSQEDQDQLVQQMDFEALRDAMTANAKQAQDILNKYGEKGTRGKIGYARSQDKLQDIMLKLSRSTNIYTTALVSVLVHAITMTNTVM